MKYDQLLTKIEGTFAKNSDLRKLLVDTCHIISESGNYSLCWIGIINETTRWMEPISECISKTELLETINLTLNPGFPTSNIFSDGNYYVNNNIWDDPFFKVWRDNPILSKFKSITIFPLIQNLKTIGAVYLYSDTKGFFMQDELMLLQILSMNLSLALDNLQSDEIEKVTQPDLANTVQELKRQNGKLIINREKAEELNRLKASFLTNMGHKLRTPLNSIIGFAEFLSKSDNTDAERQEYSQLIVNQSNNLLQHINNILQISKLDSRTVPLYKEVVSLNTLLDDLHEIYFKKLESLNKKQIELICRKPPWEGNFELTTDISKLRQIFTNLLDNSVKFTDSGQISFGYYSHNEVDSCCFVSDTGVGINTEHLKNLFDIFKQSDEISKRSYGDPGLGLAICKENAQLLGGDIWVLSPPDKGTTFYFTLKYRSKGTNPASVKSRIKILHWTTHQILLVEDDNCTIQYLTKILEQDGHKLFVAHNRKETEELYQKLSEIDLVLLDMSLPDVSGLDLAKQIKIIRKDIPVIAQTAMTVEDNGKQFLDAGCDGYITKPYRRDQVLTAINHFMSA
jgi:signal transduction histidine kinase/CheY-like chemotaxis protein